MTIHLPEDLQRYVHDQVLSGRFRSEDDVVLDALSRHRQAQQAPAVPSGIPDPLLGSMRDAADELDEIVAEAMKRRREEPWRAIPGE